MIEKANADPKGWIRFLEILESEGFTSTEDVCLLPETDDKELSKSLKSHITWLWTLRNSFAHNTILCYGNIAISNDDLIEQYVLQRLQLLQNQAMSSLKRGQYLSLTRKIENLSKCWGVTVKQDCLDISFHNGKLVSHPLVHYLNLRNNIIFDKIDYFQDLIKTGLYDRQGILSFRSYTESEYIPSLNLDVFFVSDLNEFKSKLKVSVLNKSYNSLMKTIDIDLSEEGEYFR
jgi:hypothetical protein